MPKSKSKPKLTARQRESQKIAKEKAARLRRQTLRRRCMLGFSAVMVASVAGLLWWMWTTDAPAKLTARALQSVYAFSGDHGFRVRDMYVEGRRITPMAEIREALGLGIGDPIFQYSVTTLRERLEALPYVRSAVVERELPGTLHIHLLEREPVAMWSHQGKYLLVDMDGKIMPGQGIKTSKRLPLIAGGEDAPEHVPNLMRLLVSEPDLFKQVASAARIGDRRWNVRLKNGIEVKLPERNPEQAWRRLAQMQREQNVLARAVSSIDLRLEDRVFIRLLPSAVPAEGGKGPARET